jgi:putative transposase
MNDQLLKVAPLLELVGDWADFLALPSEQESELLRKHERTGRPLV